MAIAKVFELGSRFGALLECSKFSFMEQSHSSKFDFFLKFRGFKVYDYENGFDPTLYCCMDYTTVCYSSNYILHHLLQEIFSRNNDA